jgi:hypothetical protein
MNGTQNSQDGTPHTVCVDTAGIELVQYVKSLNIIALSLFVLSNMR